MKDRYIYPAILEVDEDRVDIWFPDLPGCLPGGDSIEEAIKDAKEILALHLYGMEEENLEIPEPTPINRLNLKANQCVVLIETWMPPYRDKMNNMAVKKTLTIPKWLDTLAEQNNVNFSHVLQDALKKYLGVQNRGN